MTTAQKPDWKAVVARKRAERDALIPAEYDIPASKLPPVDGKSVVSFPATCGLLTPAEVAITEIDDVDVLLAKLAKREYTAAEVLEAYIKRACIAHRLVNPITEIHFDDARRWARELDDELQATGKTRGPLHGLPVSLKDQFRIKGSDATIAYVSYVGRQADHDAVCTALLKEAGAVPFVKTNLPQTIMFAETRNELFGTTLNPHNRLLHTGGSSGGEGALVAIKGSPLGVGTDVGGSVRIPAGMCGLFGLRPSSHRFPYEGAVNSMEGQETIPSVLGPLTRTLSGLTTFTKAILAGRPWLYDPLVPEMPWSQSRYDAAKAKKGLKIGLMSTDLHVHPFPPYERALQVARDALTKAGHDVVPFVPYEPGQGLAIMGDAFCADGGRDVLEAISGCDEPLGPQVTGVGKPEKSAYELWQINKRKTVYRKRALDHWRDAGVDFVLCPTSVYPAMKHDDECWILYTGLWNLLDYTAISLPVSSVDAKLDPKRSSPPHDGWYSDDDRRWNDKYDPDLVDGAPIGLQVVAGRYREEEALGFAETVWHAIRG
ncbi:uncharacterized protein PFL1_05345 [Pseudozyma flocculosa PF-1]|uniref:amidase n=2 Tax=Pseudozyma flocculosa TaxID=84751 RepID=A0A5C3FCZ8_9BASI|nr:uncharacterized protein PFL1_05345 [Pseudozyma flocculosa PF-1]EPQ27061.1 hypothetical protein PFL1_05345 [Pseudozyma flocculosa PF-1]SPO42140.1 related to AMD2 - acetamidase [Pseudozyma flocculosa]